MSDAPQSGRKALPARPDDGPSLVIRPGHGQQAATMRRNDAPARPSGLVWKEPIWAKTVRLFTAFKAFVLQNVEQLKNYQKEQTAKDLAAIAAKNRETSRRAALKEQPQQRAIEPVRYYTLPNIVHNGPGGVAYGRQFTVEPFAPPYQHSPGRPLQPNDMVDCGHTLNRQKVIAGKQMRADQMPKVEGGLQVGAKPGPPETAYAVENAGNAENGHPMVLNGEPTHVTDGTVVSHAVKCTDGTWRVGSRTSYHTDKSRVDENGKPGVYAITQVTGSEKVSVSRTRSDGTGLEHRTFDDLGKIQAPPGADLPSSIEEHHRAGPVENVKSTWSFDADKEMGTDGTGKPQKGGITPTGGARVGSRQAGQDFGARVPQQREADVLEISVTQRPVGP
jgi:hypothetical protein